MLKDAPFYKGGERFWKNKWTQCIEVFFVCECVQKIGRFANKIKY